MKKKLSILLAAVMILTLLPAMGVSAATSASVSNIPTVASDYNFAVQGNFNGATQSMLENAPQLVIRNNSSTAISQGAGFNLTLNNALWRYGTDTGSDSWNKSDFPAYTAGNRQTEFGYTSSGTITVTSPVLQSDTVDLSDAAHTSVTSTQTTSAKTLDVGAAINTVFSGNQYYVPTINITRDYDFDKAQKAFGLDTADPAVTPVWPTGVTLPRFDTVLTTSSTPVVNSSYGPISTISEVTGVTPWAGLATGQFISYYDDKTGAVAGNFYGTETYPSLATWFYNVLRDNGIGSGSQDAFRMFYVDEPSTISGRGYVVLDTAEYILGDVNPRGGDAQKIKYVMVITSDNYAQVTTLEDMYEDDVIQIPLIVKMDGSGEATVSISGGANQGISNDSNRTFAIGSGGATDIWITDTTNFPKTASLDAIILEELRFGTIKTKAGDDVVRLRLPNGFYWDNSSLEVIPTGGFANWSEQNFTSRVDDDRDLYITLRGTANDLVSTTLGSFTINGLKVVAKSREASFGDVYVTATGDDISTKEFKIGAYIEYGVSFEADDKDLPEIISGIYPKDHDDSEIETLKTTFKEDTIDAWWAGRETTFTFPSEVKVRAVKIKFENINGLGTSSTVYYPESGKAEQADNNPSQGEVYFDGNIISLSDFTVENNKKAKIEMTYYLSIEPGFEGDIDVVAGGRGMDEELTATIAKAVTPISVETSTTELRLGYKGLPVSDIYISENMAGALKRDNGNDLIGTVNANSSIEFSTTALVVSLANYIVFEDTYRPDVTITEGDLSLDTTNIKSGAIEISVKGESSKASTIRISNLTVDLDRTLPEGDYALRVGGSVAANYTSRPYSEDVMPGGFDTEYYTAKSDYIRIITAAPDRSSQFITPVTITIGEQVIQVGEGTITMDTVAFIEGGRTMFPVSWVAQAFGLDKDRDLIWDQNSQTATIFNGDRVVSVTVGASYMKVNGADIPVSEPAINRDSRVFLALKDVLERVLGLTTDQYRWEASNSTVYINQ